MSLFPIMAGHAGLCPCCGTYIRPGRSMVATLGVALPPRPSLCYFGREGWTIAGAPGHVRPRRWLRASCAEKLDALYSFAELEALAGDWRAELAQHKRRSAAEQDRLAGPRPQKRKAQVAS
jgi:hypothetical protein